MIYCISLKFPSSRTFIKPNTNLDVKIQRMKTTLPQNYKKIGIKVHVLSRKRGVRRLYAQKQIVNKYEVTISQKLTLEKQSEVKRHLRFGFSMPSNIMATEVDVEPLLLFLVATEVDVEYICWFCQIFLALTC